MSYQPIPVAEARRVAQAYRRQIVVIVDWDAENNATGFTTYGKSVEDKVLAATVGDRIKEFMLPGEPITVHEDFRRSGERAVSFDKMLAALKSLVSMIDEVAIDTNLGDETDRVFAHYEFNEARAAIEAAEAIPLTTSFPEPS